MLKVTQKVLDYLAKYVVTPVGLAVAGSVFKRAHEDGNPWLLLLALGFLLWFATVAVLLLTAEDRKSGSVKRMPVKKSKT